MCLLFTQCGCINIDTLDWLFKFLYKWIGCIHAMHNSATYNVRLNFRQFRLLEVHNLNRTLLLYVYHIHFFILTFFLLQIRYTGNPRVWKMCFVQNVHCVMWMKVCCILAGELILHTSVCVLFYFIFFIIYIWLNWWIITWKEFN